MMHLFKHIVIIILILFSFLIRTIINNRPQKLADDNLSRGPMNSFSPSPATTKFLK